MNERERRLDVGLLQSGKFAEALAGLEKWLADTEDMVNNQKPPSADYKVVKAQLQEQKVCLKEFKWEREQRGSVTEKITIALSPILYICERSVK